MLLATKFVYENAHKTLGGDQDKSEEEIAKINDVLETVREEFLDSIFDENSKMTREEWIEAVATKEKWLFDSKLLRARVQSKVDDM